MPLVKNIKRYCEAERNASKDKKNRNLSFLLGAKSSAHQKVTPTTISLFPGPFALLLHATICVDCSNNAYNHDEAQTRNEAWPEHLSAG